MLFKYPQVLYALFLLVIPILVHLFQLRKFKKTVFTNVQFLKQVSQQTRKSAQLKKWLTLLTRLLLFASIIIAFAQPYFPSSEAALKENELVIYLDNSFSMQAKGERGILLNRAVQEIIDQLPKEERFTLYTNSATYQNTTLASIREELKDLEFSAKESSLKDAIYKGTSFFTEAKDKNKELILISDGQGELDIKGLDSNIAVSLLLTPPENLENLAIDSLYMTEKFQQTPTLNVSLFSSTQTAQNTTVALYDADQLLAKTSVSFDDSRKASAKFTLSTPIIANGRVEIIDNGLSYDNSFYFSINQADPIEVVALSGTKDDFLKRLYPLTEFNYQNFTEESIDFSNLSKANTLIINELDQVPPSLLPIIEKHLSKERHLIIIPPNKLDLSGYGNLIQKIAQLSLGEKKKQERLLTSINYDHPLYENVFDRRVENFQYPKVQEYSVIKNATNSVLQFENDDSFLVEKNGIYLFSSSLTTKVTNFKNSPLIVPTFYNIARQSAKTPKLYYIIENAEEIGINAQLKKDRVLHLKSAQEQFIPLQQNLGERVILTTDELPAHAGNFKVLQDEQRITTLSFNYDRQESQLNYLTKERLPDFIEVKESISTFFKERSNQNSITGLYKWFLIFALIALLLEIMLLKYLK